MRVNFALSILVLLLQNLSHSSNSVVVKVLNGFDGNQEVLSPATLELGFAHSHNPFEVEIMGGYGYRETNLSPNTRSIREKTRLISIGSNLVVGNFNDAKTFFIGFGYHYMSFKYKSFGRSFSSNGYLIPLISGYRISPLKNHMFGLEIAKPFFSDLEFEIPSFSGPEDTYRSPFIPYPALMDITVSFTYKFSLN